MKARPESIKSTIVIAATALIYGCSPPDPALGTFDYERSSFPDSCRAEPRSGATGGTLRLETAAGLRVTVRTPANYDATRGHPLLVVYAPGGHHRYQSERFAELTPPATTRGFIVAYPDHIAVKLANFKLLGEVPEAVASKWCVDPKRVFFTGHSDGGLSSEAVVFLDVSSLPVAGIVASGAGIRGEDLAEYTCAAPRPVMIVHSKNDELFPPPAFGLEAARWWAACNRCTPTTSAEDKNGCIAYHGCSQGAPTVFCETQHTHREWHGLNTILLDFLMPPSNK